MARTFIVTGCSALILACGSKSNVAGDSSGSGGGSSVGVGGDSTVGAGGGPGAGGGGGSGPGSACNDRPRGTPPGQVVVDRNAPGAGACAGKTLGDVIAEVYTAHPELADITRIYDPASVASDGSFIFAFSTSDGFALVFERGGGDCPAGCTEREYWYFQTASGCTVTPVGHLKLPPDAGCVPVDQKPMWGMPDPLPISWYCGADTSTHDLSGTYSVLACGSRAACQTSGKDAPIEMVLSNLTMVIAQDPADLSHGTVTLTGSAVPELDGTAIPADFVGRSFSGYVATAGPSAACNSQHTTTIRYDFDRFGDSHARADVVDTPDCSHPLDYCKGFFDAALGPPAR